MVDLDVGDFWAWELGSDLGFLGELERGEEPGPVPVELVMTVAPETSVESVESVALGSGELVEDPVSSVESAGAVEEESWPSTSVEERVRPWGPGGTATAAVAASEAAADAKAAKWEAGQVDVVRDMLWAYDHIGDKRVRRRHAPSGGAWELLQYAKENKKTKGRFFETTMPKLIAVLERREKEAERAREAARAASEAGRAGLMLDGDVVDGGIGELERLMRSVGAAGEGGQREA
jgi:hypothetical protein